MSYYLSPDRTAAEAAEAAIFAAYRERIRAIDPEAVAEDGSLIGRNAATGELMPDATRTTGFFGQPLPAVQGFYHPVPTEKDLQLADPGDVGVEVTVHLNPWPVVGLDGAPPDLPEWRQPRNASEVYPAGAWVMHEGRAYQCLTPGLTVAPEPRSTVWRVSPDPGPLPWEPVTGYENAYAKDAVVEHEGRFFRSTYDGNDQIPGTDPRYWVEVPAPVKEATDWVAPVPGDGSTLYEIEDEVLKDGKRWRSTCHLNAFEPGAVGWEEVVE